MNYLEQLLLSPQIYAFLPIAAFVLVAVGIWCFWRPTPLGTEAVGVAQTDQPKVPAKPKDQRGMSRRHGNPVEVHVAAPADKSHPGIGSVLDRSMGGMRLALYHEVEAGAILAIRPTHADNMVPWVELEVRSCKDSKEMPGQFEVGCQYVKSPPYSIQLLFG